MLEDIVKNKTLLYILILLVIIAGTGIQFYIRVLKNPTVIEKITEQEDQNPLITDKPLSAFVCIHIAGAVKKPGVYNLSTGKRLIDAINMAGGISQGADISGLNLAEKIKDGQKIEVPIIKEPSYNTVDSKLVNINDADLKQMDSIPGIGPVMAKRIIEYREKNSRFSKIDDLTKVKGIGKGKFAKIKEFVTTN